MNATQAFQWIVSQSAGNNEASNNGILGTTANAGANVSAANPGSARTGRYGLATGSQGNLAEEIATLGLGGHAASWQQALTAANSSGAAPYLSAEQKSGQRSPVLEAILQNTSSSDQVLVNTASGQRVMSIADAMKYYPNELASGNVQFYNSSGQALGNTSSITQGLVNTSANVSGEEKQKAGSGSGVTISAWEKAHPSAAPTAGTQAVTISLSAEAQQLLKLLPSNNDQAAATSTVPANTSASQASR
jgi:hypothetical protein